MLLAVTTKTQYHLNVIYLLIFLFYIFHLLQLSFCRIIGWYSSGWYKSENALHICVEALKGKKIFSFFITIHFYQEGKTVLVNTQWIIRVCPTSSISHVYVCTYIHKHTNTGIYTSTHAYTCIYILTNTLTCGAEMKYDKVRKIDFPAPPLYVTFS